MTLESCLCSLVSRAAVQQHLAEDPGFAMQLVAQVIGLLGALLAGYELSWSWLPVIAALLAVVLVLLWVPWLGRKDTPPPNRAEQVIDATARRWGDE